MADRPAGLLLVAAIAVALSGCVDRDGQPTERTTSVSPPPVRTDREPIASRFPNLGDFVEVHWQASTAGTDDPGVPGPTDTRIEAVVVLRPDTLAAALKRYEWSPAPAGWAELLSTGLRPFLPDGGTWHANDQYAEDVRTTHYNGLVYLDTSTGTVILRVIDS
ncbi:hypothetical protein KIF24_13360 [Micromonospora sp. Llam7]|uniref:hypothetical protein n=1 Tax=Micromonospora tarapacensis TaxID=2835305 RepID=UPI001C83E5AD|nr:hypothetical protein [Micromonospora tarapacensis]MBX7266918.1 hypothetical protein [Micromonospora tarapacensis]